MDPHIAAIISTAVEQTAARVQRELRAKPPVPKVWLKTTEAAIYLSCDIDWLEKMRRDGVGPKFRKRAARMVRYSIHDLDRWMAGGRAGTK